MKEKEQAQKVIDAAHFFKDDVFTRISDLDTVQHLYLLIFIIIRIVFVRISALMSTKASLNQLKLYRLVYLLVYRLV